MLRCGGPPYPETVSMVETGAGTATRYVMSQTLSTPTGSEELLGYTP